jgi:small redox-active disulfide protein 2
MVIKVLGTGCAKCKTLEHLTKEVVEMLAIDAEVQKVEDIMAIMAYNVMTTPALVINEIVVLRGKIPSKQELIEIVKQYA